MQHELQIKKATTADLDGITALYQAVCDHLATHENHPGWKKDVYPARVDAQNALSANALYVAKSSECITGTVILNHEPETGYQNGNWLTENDYNHIYVVHTLAVHPDHLKCGIATKLLLFAEQLARQEGCVSIRLDVSKRNLPAQRLYQKCGYQQIGTVSLGLEAYGLPWFELYEKAL